MEIITEVIEWLKDQRRYKKTFIELTANYSPSDQIFASILIRNFRAAGLLSEEYLLEGTFIAYSKWSYATLMAVAIGVDKDSE